MTSDPTRPNILWISTHDINPHLGTYSGIWPGAEAAVTPNLDRLAAQGVRYDTAVAAAPVCAPSRSAIMTGCFPTAIGTMHMRTKAVPPPEVRLLSEYFRQAGYYCTNNFFTDFQVGTPGTAFDECGPTAHWRNRPEGAPFFAAFHGMITHEFRIHADEEAHLASTPDLSPDDRRDPAELPLPPYYPDTEAFRQAWRKYFELITQMDHWAGELLRELDDAGVADNTIVVFWSDHGIGLPRAKRYAYESGLREPLIVRWSGVIPAGSVRTEPVHLMDLAPTMLEACGLPVPPHMHGRPRFDATGFREPESDYVFGGRDRMDEQEDMTRTVRDRRYRYIRHFHPDRPLLQHLEYADRLSTWHDLRRLSMDEATQRALGIRPDLLNPVQRRVLAASKPAEELYDLTADPHETVDLAADPAYAGELERFREALAGWQSEYGDLGLIPEDELAERWRPGGEWSTTAEPRVELRNGLLHAECATEGALIGWTTDPPTDPDPPSFLAQVSGDPEVDGRRWTIYAEPFSPPVATVWIRAWRIGFHGSPEVEISAVPLTA